jgi:hypothetical protein
MEAPTCPANLPLYLAGVICHGIQRGNNREACFFSDFADLGYPVKLETVLTTCGYEKTPGDI